MRGARLLTCLVMPALAAGAFAQADAPPPPDEVPMRAEDFPPAPPPPPAPTASAADLEPEVTIVQRAAETVSEYRVGGRLYMVRIQPAVGPAYYLIDNDGDGSLESRAGSLYNPDTIPTWVLFTWD